MLYFNGKGSLWNHLTYPNLYVCSGIEDFLANKNQVQPTAWYQSIRDRGASTGTAIIIIRGELCYERKGEYSEDMVKAFFGEPKAFYDELGKEMESIIKEDQKEMKDISDITNSAKKAAENMKKKLYNGRIRDWMSWGSYVDVISPNNILSNPTFDTAIARYIPKRDILIFNEIYSERKRAKRLETQIRIWDLIDSLRRPKVVIT